MDMTALERQQASLKWQQQQQQNYMNQNTPFESCSMPQYQGFIANSLVNGNTVDWKKMPEMYLVDYDFPKYGNYSVAGTEFVPSKKNSAQADATMRCLDIDHCLSRNSRYQKGLVEAAEMEEEMEAVELAGQHAAMMEKMQSNHGSDKSNKRKSKSVAAEEYRGKRIKRKKEVGSKVKEESCTENSADSSKENQKTSTLQKTEYIHVRARRGQATDSHSLAERARREKISKKMKCLQDLVPGCNKIIGRAGMLDEIINYVQSLQRQVEFLSMKLATLCPRLEFNINNLSGKEFPAYVTSFPAAAMSSSINSLSHLQLNLAQQQATASSLDALLDAALKKTTSFSEFIPELCLDSSCFSQVQPFCDGDSQTLHNMGFHQG